MPAVLRLRMIAVAGLAGILGIIHTHYGRSEQIAKYERERRDSLSSA